MEGRDIQNFSTTNIYCVQCQGKYWDDNSAIRHANVVKEFNIVPNPCVGSMQKPAVCPFVRKKEEVKSDD